MSFMALLGNPSLTGMVTTFDSEMAIDVYTDIQSGALVNNILSQEQRTAMDVNKEVYMMTQRSLGHILHIFITRDQ
jgi:hypothetical protein